MSDTSPIILGDEERLISELADVTLQTFFDQNETQFLSDVGAVATTTAFGIPEGVIHIESQGGIASTSAFGTSELQLKIDGVGAIASTVAFGLAETPIFVEEVGAIASTTVVPTQGPVTLLIGGANKDVGGIASTVSISTDGGFQGGIFRALIYKEGEISGIGSAESMFIAGGIRINPSSRISTTASAGSQTLPSNPVGFISVNINGTDYKVPYYNT